MTVDIPEKLRTERAERNRRHKLFMRNPKGKGK